MRTLTLLAACCLSLQAADVSPIAGDWHGFIDFKGEQHHIGVHLIQSGDSWRGTIDAIDQGATGIPAGEVKVTGTKLSVRIPAVTATYDGELNGKSGVITGWWSQGGVKIPLELRPMGEGDKPKRPQEPKPPYPYISENVAYDNPAAKGVRLAGTFTKPKGAGPFRAVLLITGSGLQNRDEEIMGHKPFLVLADYLTRHGIAVLRVDDRGFGESTGDVKNATTEDFAGDAMAGVRYLLARADVDKKHVGLIGHSEGGAIAPMVAVKMPEIAFIVMLAGDGVPGAQVIEDQVFLVNLASGISKEVAEANRDFEHKLLAGIMADLPKEKILEIAGDNTALRKGLESELPSMQSKWYRWFLAYDPRPTLEQVKCPVLALNGSKDVHIGAALNPPAVEAALRKGKNADFTVQVIPGLNHLFQTAKTGLVAEYGQIEETISPKVLEMVADWIAKR